MITGFDSRYWNGVYPAGYDYDFVIIKATEAHNFTAQPQMKLQTEGAMRAGLRRGYYHFYRFWSDAKQQAKWFYDNAPRDADLPPVIDLEDGQAPKGLQNVNKIKILCEEVEQLFGKRPMIYTAAWWWDPWVFPYLPATGWNYTAHDLWVANYTAAAVPWLPRGFDDWQMWQYIGDWAAPGFNAKIDVDRVDEDWYKEVTGQHVVGPKEGINKELDCVDINITKIRKLMEEI